MSNGINLFDLHSFFGFELFREQPTVVKITNVYKRLIMQPDHAHPRLQWLTTTNSEIFCLNWPALRCSINSFIAKTKSINRY